jgi:VWFA-related protein
MLKKALALACPILLLSGQSPPPSTLRVSTRLVQISVVAHEKNQPVSDLTKRDFTLFEQGKPRTISLFSVSSSKAEIAKASPLPPNTFSNYIEHQANRPSTITIILFDSINTPVENQMYARQELIKFVKDLQSQDRIALYVLGRSLKVLIDFTADAGEIQRTLVSMSTIQDLDIATAKSTPSDVLSNPRDVTQNVTVNGGLDVAAQMETDFITATSVQVTLQALEAIANRVARLPGRKNLVWVSGGFPFAINLDVFHPFFQPRTFAEETKRATRVLNEANVAVYPVDARGLIGLSSQQGSQAGGPSTPALLPARTPGSKRPLDNYPESIDSMKHLAGLTGGRAFYNTMDIKGAVRSAMEDTSVTYTLGFYPDPATLDDKFHDIKVQVNRKGVDVRYRQGYFAFKDEMHSDQQRRQELADALWSPLDAAAIPLVMRLEPVNQPEPGLLRAYLAADLRSLTVEEQSNGHWLGSVDVLLVQQDKTGKSLDSSLQTLNLDLDKPNYEAIQKSGVPLGKYLRPKPGLVNVRAIVMDRPSGKIGSLIVPVAQVH